MTLAKERVQAGVRVLNEYYPGWRERIDEHARPRHLFAVAHGFEAGSRGYDELGAAWREELAQC